MERSRIANSMGFTLVELIISLAIFTIVMGGVSSLFLYGNKVFTMGNNQYEIQSSIREASDYLTDELRYAADIEVLEDMDPSLISEHKLIHPYDSYIYYDKNDGCIKKINSFTPSGAVEKSFKIGNPGDSFIDFDFDEAGKTLKFTIYGKSGNRQYTVNTKVYALNEGIDITPVPSPTPAPAPSDQKFTVICYKTISDHLAASLMPVMEIYSDEGAGISNDAKTLNLISGNSLTGAVVSYQGTASTDTDDQANAAANTGNNNIKMTIANGASIGRVITLDVTFADGSVYTYMLKYNGAGTGGTAGAGGWSIE